MWEALHAAGMKYETEVVCGTGKCFVHGVNEGDWEKNPESLSMPCKGDALARAKGVHHGLKPN